MNAPLQPHHPSEDWPGSCRGRQPVLCANGRGGRDFIAVMIVESDWDIKGAVARLVDDVEL